MKLLEKLVEVTTRHPIITIFIVLGLTLTAMIPASNFSVDTKVEGWFGEGDPEIMKAQETKDRFGAQDLITVVVDCSGSDTATAEEYVELLGGKLKEDDRWKDIRYKHDLSFAGEKAILYLPEEQLTLLSNPDMTEEELQAYHASILDEAKASRYVASDNGQIYLINTGVTIVMGDAMARESLFTDLRDLIEETQSADESYTNLDVGITGGLMVIEYESGKIVMQDFFLTAIITLIFLLLLMFVSFRSLSLPLLSLLPLIVGIIWTSGIIFLLYDSLNMLSIMFAILILGLGVDYSIHLLTRFMDEMDEHNDITLAFRSTFRHTGKVVILGCLTTTTVFFSFCFAKTEALHQFGVVGALGLILTLIAVFVMLPALVTLRLKFGGISRKRARFNILRTLGSQVQRFAFLIIVLLVILLVVFGIRSQYAELNSNMYELFPTEVEAYQQMEKVKENFEYNPDYLTCVVESEPELERSVKELGGVESLLGVESVLDYLPPNQEEKLAIIEQAVNVHPGLAGLPWANMSPMAWNELPEDMQEAWVSDNGKFLIRIIPTGNLYDREYQQALLADLRQVHQGVTGEPVLWTSVLDMMVEDMISVSLISSILLLVIVYVGTRRRNPVYAVLSLVPVVFGIVCLLGTYQWFGANLNFFSVATIPLIIGIGIDDGIHILHRYLEEGKGSIPQTMQLSGKAIFLTTATTCLAFSSFLFSSHPSMRFLALVPIIGLTFCFFGAIIFLPALLRVIVDRHTQEQGG